MKVLQVISSISSARGGPSAALRDQVRALIGQGIHVDVATTNDDGGKTHNVVLNEFLPMDGGRVIYFSRQTEFYAASLPMLRWLLAHARDYDLLHIHGLFNFAATGGALAATIARRPYVLTPHGTLNSWGRHYRRPKLKNVSMRLMESRIIAGAKLLHFTSHVEKVEASDLGFSTPAMVVPLGVDLDALLTQPAHAESHAQTNELNARDNVLFLSRIDRIKNLDVLLRAMHSVVKHRPATTLSIAGDGDAALVAELKTLGRELGLEPNLRWLGFVSGPVKTQLLANSALLVMPSQSENFGLAAVEAMAHAVPVILTPGVGLAPIVERYAAGSICNIDPELLAKTMLCFLNDAELRQRAGNAASQLVHNELSLDIFGIRLRQMYQQILGSVALPRQQTAYEPPP